MGLNDAYKEQFKQFVLQKLPDFYKGIGEFYQKRGGNSDSLTYFENHWPRFEMMIDIAREIWPESACEIGSFFPYTTYFWKCKNPALTIDLYDIILRELKGDVKPYDVDGIKLIDLNLCTEKLPDKGYDLIILSEVLEHLPINLMQFSNEVVRLLNPCGYLIVSYPCQGYAPQCGYDKDMTGYDFNFLQEGHLREFTWDTVDLFFTGLSRIKKWELFYKAYGKMVICLYQR